MPQILGEFVSKTKKRLTSRHRHLKDVGKGMGKTRVAIARELCGFVWELAIKVSPELDKIKVA